METSPDWLWIVVLIFVVGGVVESWIEAWRKPPED